MTRGRFACHALAMGSIPAIPGKEINMKIIKAGKADLEKILSLQYLAYQSEARLNKHAKNEKDV